VHYYKFTFRDAVMMLSAVGDPDGTEQRKKHKLKKRTYHNKVCVWLRLYYLNM